MYLKKFQNSWWRFRLCVGIDTTVSVKCRSMSSTETLESDFTAAGIVNGPFMILCRQATYTGK